MEEIKNFILNNDYQAIKDLNSYAYDDYERKLEQIKILSKKLKVLTNAGFQNDADYILIEKQLQNLKKEAYLILDKIFYLDLIIAEL